MTVPKETQRFIGFQQRENESEDERRFELLERDGYFVIEHVFDDGFLQETRERMGRIWDAQLAQYGEELLERIGDHGVMRAMMEVDPFFLEYIRHPTIFRYVEATVGPTAILHLQNGVVAHPDRPHNQGRYHRDFPKNFLPSKIISFNAFIALDDFNEQTGGTWVVPGTHRFESLPSEEYVEAHEKQLSMPAGSVLFFDSMLWHRGGVNYSSSIRRGMNHQFTRPFIKQQLDYPVIMKGKVDLESPIAQTLGMWSVAPKSVSEYRVSDPKMRTYRAGQG
jgi:ectoine hydroxylase-related dioxygenase (phytanoyl-CoA dioxygenase family)